MALQAAYGLTALLLVSRLWHLADATPSIPVMFCADIEHGR